MNRRSEARSAPSPTPRQLEVLATIERLRAELGVAPTFRELGEELGIASNNGVADHLAALTKHGWLKRIAGSARSLSVTPAGLRWLAPARAA
ncbi:MAG: hypothetical protein JNJ54_35180 [Myxococcaceae bacterium]|nr:hypothetical protein [Myxococcaceae bacterium]